MGEKRFAGFVDEIRAQWVPHWIMGSHLDDPVLLCRELKREGGDLIISRFDFDENLKNWRARYSTFKSALKAQEIIPLLSGGHVLRHDLLTTALMPTTEERLSNNVTVLRQFGASMHHK